jgi:hypothetical protein
LDVGFEELLVVDLDEILLDLDFDRIVVNFDIGKQVTEDSQHFHNVQQSGLAGNSQYQCIFI